MGLSRSIIFLEFTFLFVTIQEVVCSQKFQEDSNLELTPLGFHLSRLPVDVRIGKLMLFGAIFKCLVTIFSQHSILTKESGLLCIILNSYCQIFL
jgi:hypothetical protein